MSSRSESPRLARTSFCAGSSGSNWASASRQSGEPTMSSPRYRRILLKLNGEALAGEAGWGIDVPTVEAIAAQITRVHAMGIEIAIVIGAGNIWRGVNGLERGMERA